MQTKKISEFSNKWLLDNLCHATLTPFAKQVRKEVLRRMTPNTGTAQTQKKQEMLDRFIRTVVVNSRKRGFKVKASDFAKLREHLLQK